MKKFSKIVENVQSKRFKVDAEVELTFEADNEGEAGYLADSELGSIESQTNYRISNITEIGYDDSELETPVQENYTDSSIVHIWDQKFGERKPSMTEKMEFYHDMRKSGYDGLKILNTLKDKISFYTR